MQAREVDARRLEQLADSLLAGKIGAVVVTDRVGDILVSVGDSLILSGKVMFPPGSVMKLISASAALKFNIVPDKPVRCRYWYRIPGDSIRCNWAPGHGLVDIRKAISASCNYYFCYLVDNGLSAQKIHAHIIELVGKLGEDIKWTFNFTSAGEIDKYRLAIGLSGILVSPTGMVRLIKEMVTSPVLSEEHRAIIISAMADAVDSGVSRSAKIVSEQGVAYSIAGKTGTAPLPGDCSQTCGWFVGFAPTDEPQYFIAVLIVPGKGFYEPAQIGGKILKVLLEKSR